MRRFSSATCRALALAALATTLGTGCYGAGKKIPQETLADMQPGTTTCLAVRLRYGPPTSSTLASGQGEQLIYAYSQMNIDPKSYIPVVGRFVSQSHSEMTTVTFQCDARGVLESYVATQGQDTLGTGFISGAPQK